MCFVLTGACNFRLKHPLHGGAASALRQSQSKSSRLHSSRSRRQGSVGRSVPETPRQSERHCEGNIHVWFLGWWTLTEPPNNLPPTIGIYTVYIYIYVYIFEWTNWFQTYGNLGPPRPNMSALLRTFSPPWESKVAAMETLDGMPCASLTGAAFKLLSLRKRVWNIRTSISRAYQLIYMAAQKVRW